MRSSKVYYCSASGGRRNRQHYSTEKCILFLLTSPFQAHFGPQETSRRASGSSARGQQSRRLLCERRQPRAQAAMRWTLLSTFAPLLASALPIPSMPNQTAPQTSTDIEILDFSAYTSGSRICTCLRSSIDFETAWTQFAVAPVFQHGELTTPLVSRSPVRVTRDPWQSYRLAVTPVSDLT